MLNQEKVGVRLGQARQACRLSVEDVADRMAEDTLRDGRLAVVGRASHSVMTDNPAGFAEAVAEFVLGE